MFTLIRVLVLQDHLRRTWTWRIWRNCAEDPEDPEDVQNLQNLQNPEELC